MSTPQARSLAWFRERGYLAEGVEKWKRFPDKAKHFCPVCKTQPMMQIRSDLWNFADILAIKPLPGDRSGFNGDVVLCQVTDRGDHTKRLAKVIGSVEAAKCAAAGVRIVIQSWGKMGAKGKRKLWQMRETVLTLEDFREYGTSCPTLDEPSVGVGLEAVPDEDGGAGAVATLFDGLRDEPLPSSNLRSSS